ncbi:hypothetical protein HMN09_00742000 [Mycena chlorophos]|uniref:Uncharacterized protein n=1 Tax=Mycena chlorophos TaxID=658473 RepID=A0A8H6SU25_MYCCL|nr:hypothetical protein HMN09_00742000 [Mycena chlorophos]
MPVTFKVADHKANPVEVYGTVNTARQVLAAACPQQYDRAGNILQSSFDEPDPEASAGESSRPATKSKFRSRLSKVFSKKPSPTPEPSHPGTLSNIIPNSNGFFHALSTAYNKHHHLVLRPDDVWLAILTQFNYFVNANAELLRANFVAHEGKKELVVLDTQMSDFAKLARVMGQQIEKNVVDPTLRTWVVPNFSTTTVKDTTVAAIVLMATLKSYFEYVFCEWDCGIPSVTLLGERADWENLLGRAEKLKEYTLETIAWYHLLVPVLTRFVRAFDDPEAESNVDFWQRMVDIRPGGSGPSACRGWIAAFCVFNDKGEWIGPELKLGYQQTSTPRESLPAKDFWDAYLARKVDTSTLPLDGTPYHVLDPANIPPCYAEVDVLLKYVSGQQIQTTMVAGVVAAQVGSSSDGSRDVLKPMAGWWMFEKV